MSWYGDMVKSGLKYKIFDVLISVVDNEDGTATLTLQVVDAFGDSMSDLFLLRVWVAGNIDGEPSGDGAVDAITGITVATGVEMNEHTSNGDYTVLTDSDGKAVLTLTESAGTIHALAAVLGKVETKQVDITS